MCAHVGGFFGDMEAILHVVFVFRMGRRTPCRSTRLMVGLSEISQFPVEVLMKNFTPQHPGDNSKRPMPSAFSAAAPMKKAKSHHAPPLARVTLSGMA
jgi:hypothetical protein